MKDIFLIIDKNFTKQYGLPQHYIGKSIVLYHNHRAHLYKHKNDYINQQSYIDALNNIKTVIQSPEFICEDNKNNSLLFVGTIHEDILIAVRISNNKELKIRTMYPINTKKKNKLRAQKLR